MISILNTHPSGYRPFSAPTDSSESTQSAKPIQRQTSIGREVSWPTPSPPGFQNPKSVDKEILRNLLVFLQGKLVLLRVRCESGLSITDSLLKLLLVSIQSVPFRKPAQGLELATQLIAAVGEDLIATTKSLDRNVFMAL